MNCTRKGKIMGKQRKVASFPGLHTAFVACSTKSARLCRVSGKVQLRNVMKVAGVLKKE